MIYILENAISKTHFFEFAGFFGDIFLDIFNYYFIPYMFLQIINRPHLSYRTKSYDYLLLNLQKILCIRLGNIPYFGLFSFKKISLFDRNNIGMDLINSQMIILKVLLPQIVIKNRKKCSQNCRKIDVVVQKYDFFPFKGLVSFIFKFKISSKMIVFDVAARKKIF